LPRTSTLPLAGPTPHVALQQLEANSILVGGCRNTPDGSANDFCGVDQGAVYVEKIDPEGRNHAG
jgi:hypothetical protein